MQLLDTGLDSVDAVTKSNDDNIEKQEPVEEKLFNQKKDEILDKLIKV